RLGARVVVNASGPWVDAVRAAADVTERGARILRRTKGIHCVLPRVTERAIYQSTSDDRMIFIIPWREFSLVGTTDTDFDGDLDRLHATRDEVDYLLGEARKSLPDPRVCREEVVYTYAGVRPLSYEEGTSASKVSRAHRIVEEEGGRFLSITGTKLTCFRSLAEELGDRVSRALGRPHQPLPGRGLRRRHRGPHGHAARLVGTPPRRRAGGVSHVRRTLAPRAGVRAALRRFGLTGAVLYCGTAVAELRSWRHA